MGWLAACILAALTAAGLWRSDRLSRAAIELVLAALLIGLCGYA